MYLTSFQLAVRILVKSYYIEGHRFYHTMDHIEVMLDGYNKYFGDVSEAEYLAILYHDIVYLPFAKWNEENSVGLLNAHHKVYFHKLKPEVLQAASEIILATKHDSSPVSFAAERVVDLDLMILGCSGDVYRKYVANTRKEYAMYSDTEWKVGRTKVLQGFLAQERIFITDIMRNHFEHQARVNIQKELEELEGT